MIVLGLLIVVVVVDGENARVIQVLAQGQNSRKKGPSQLHHRPVIIIIIIWLVQWRTLPFLRACSMPVDSALGDRRLLDQC